MGRQKLANGGFIKRKNYATGAQVTSGALSGAATGAAVGSIIPGLGTAIGAGAGGLMGLIGGLTSGSQAPQMPNIVDPVTGQQITDAQGNVVATQQQLQAFSQSLQGVNGVQNQQAVLGQLQGVANGTGPNPAMAQLAQVTGTNVANTAALQAGQRGASSNVGLMARQIGQTGAQINQQAAGQAASLESQQQLNALNSEAGIAGAQVGEQQSALGEQANLGTANQGQLLSAQGGYNSNIVAGQGGVNAANQTQQSTNLGAAGQLTNAAGTYLAGKSAVSPSAAAPGATPSVSGGQYSTPANGGNIFGVGNGMAAGGMVHKSIPGPHKSHVANYLAMAKGGKVPAMVSGGEIYLSPEKVQRVLNGENPLKIGDKIRGPEIKKGDSKKNDVVPKTLEEGGVVISKTHTGNPEKAELFTRRAVHMRKAK